MGCYTASHISLKRLPILYGAYNKATQPSTTIFSHLHLYIISLYRRYFFALSLLFLLLP